MATFISKEDRELVQQHLRQLQSAMHQINRWPTMGILGQCQVVGVCLLARQGGLERLVQPPNLRARRHFEWLRPYCTCTYNPDQSDPRTAKHHMRTFLGLRWWPGSSMQKSRLSEQVHAPEPQSQLSEAVTTSVRLASSGLALRKGYTCECVQPGGGTTRHDVPVLCTQYLGRFLDWLYS